MMGSVANRSWTDLVLAAPALAVGAVSLLPALLANGQIFYAPSVGDGIQPEPQPQPASGGAAWRDAPPQPTSAFDDRDLLEILPIVIGALNASRTH
jgi:hypothetical protein